MPVDHASRRGRLVKATYMTGSRINWTFELPAHVNVVLILIFLGEVVLVPIPVRIAQRKMGHGKMSRTISRVKSVEGSRRESKLSLCFKVRIRSVIQHELPSLISTRYQDEGEKKTMEFDGEITYEVPNINSSLKEYKTLSSIIVPLSTYFSILIAHYNQFAGNATSLAIQMFSYTADLASMANEHRWHLVVAFHMAFFARRQREMIGGDYGGWGCFIVEFMEGMKF
ncbi:hypothetical protein ARMGADRAFT_1096509 [Armillaria gallica]|uniref:Uncharacterized protein n=1 Tax=Armillaria gallica TaxID=47427 RepID=A0A2H3EDG1_ARMGA|nr:hypothetical protein ARMGADRAFT_1096509 [Armillaria gallica]